MDVLALRERFKHMSHRSGYDVLYNFLDPKINIDSVFCDFTKIYPSGLGRALSLIANSFKGTKFYTAQSVEAELKLLFKYYKKDYDVVHYSYGEPYYSITSFLRKFIKSKVIITNHQPISWWEKNKNSAKLFSTADEIITLTEVDKEYFKAILNNSANINYIPHGVDVTFYRPSDIEVKNDVLRVIFAGRYLRDTKSLAEVIKKFSKTNYKIVFEIVYVEKHKVQEKEMIEIMSFKNVNWHSNLSDEHLLSLYQSSDCCLVPLEDCTANNAILEAMACGLPIISTELEAVKSYLDPSMSFLGPKGRSDELCDLILRFYNSESLRKEMGRNSRKKAVTLFSWERIANHTSSLYKA